MANDKKERVSRFVSALHESGLKVTAPRLAVLDVLLDAKTPLRIKDIAERLGRRNDESDMVTIYRTIEAFRLARAVRRLDFEEDSAYYELLDPKKDHHYMICTDCRRRFEVGGCLLGPLLPQVLERIPECAEITHHSIKFFGICKRCAKKTKTKHSISSSKRSS